MFFNDDSDPCHKTVKSLYLGFGGLSIHVRDPPASLMGVGSWTCREMFSDIMMGYRLWLTRPFAAEGLDLVPRSSSKSVKIYRISLIFIDFTNFHCFLLDLWWYSWSRSAVGELRAPRQRRLRTQHNNYHVSVACDNHRSWHAATYPPERPGTRAQSRSLPENQNYSDFTVLWQNISESLSSLKNITI